MKGRKLFITLLVVVIAMGLLLSVVACTPRPTPTPVNKNNNNDDEEESKAGEMLGEEVKTIVDVVDETIRQVFAIEDEAHLGATLFFTVNFAGTEEAPIPPIDLDLEIKVEASFDAETQEKNAVLLEVSDVTEDGLGLIASIFAVNEGESEGGSEGGSEYVYIGQKVWNSEFSWVKFSQAEDAGMLAGLVADKVFELLVGMAEENADEIEDGIVTGLVGSYLGMVSMVGPLEIIMPTTVDTDGETEVTEAGFAVTAATATFAETKVAGGTELAIKVENLGAIIGVAEFFKLDFDGLRTSLIDGKMLDLVNLLVDAILGQSFDELFSLGGATPNPDPVYPKQIAIGVGHNRTILNGIGLHYDYTNNPDLPLKLDLGIKGLVVSNSSVSTVKPSHDGYKDADEAAVELSLDVVLANGEVDATIKVYAYPTVEIKLENRTLQGETTPTPFINLNLVGIQGFATIKDNNLPENPAAYFADFQAGNPKGQNGFKLDLGPVLAALGTEITEEFKGVEQQYFIPLEAQNMWDVYFAGMTEGYDLSPLNSSVIDDISEALEGGFSIGSIMSLIGFVDPIVAELEALVEEGGPISFGFFEREDEEEPADRAAFVSIDLDALMTDLVAGVLGDTETVTFKRYYDNTTGAVLDTPVEADLAEYLASENVIESVVTLMNYNFGVSAANDAWKLKYPGASEEQLQEARDKYFDDDPDTEWTLAPIAVKDLFTETDAIRIFKAVTKKTLSAADAYAGLTLDMFASLGASSKTEAEGITLSVELLDATLGTLVKVVLNLNIKAEDTDALAAYEDSEFHTMWEEGVYVNTSQDGEALKDILFDLVTSFAQVEDETA